MKEVLSEIDTIFKLISSIPVYGNSVDLVADARARLRNLYAELENKEREENKA